MGRKRQPSRQARVPQRKKALRPRRLWYDKCKCGKVTFPDEITADMALTRTAGRKGSIRSYECTVTRGNWHTTSQEFRPGQDDEKSTQDN